MLTEIMNYFSIATQQTLFIGDTFSDLQTAQRAKIAFILVKTGKGNKTLKTGNIDVSNTPVYNSLSAYVSHLLADKNNY
jgi:D-glycero-D-manno-heptose 1,7-bisphosphate phosphatase